MRRVLAAGLAVAALGAIGVAMPAAAAAEQPATTAKKKGKKGKRGKRPLVVCKRGCRYRSIQKAVDKSRKNATIKVKPGKYVEGVRVEGHKHNGLTIKGTKKNPKKVILEGKNAKGPAGLAQNGIEVIDAKKVRILNMTARNFATNGFFLRDSNPGAQGGKNDCKKYLLKNLFAKANLSYGMYAFGCVGGRITKSKGILHGDSAFYIGATPKQKKPKWTSLDHLDGSKNVLGFSGTNSRYVDIHHSDFYNNGVGVLPNTLDSEPYEPSETGKIRKNDIFWNNLNYYLPNSPVEPVGEELGEIGPITLRYPSGIGVVLFGASNWLVQNNNIFGHYAYGSATASDPLNEGDDAISTANMFKNNANGRSGSDPNAVDFFADGSGSGNCFQGNSSSTFDPSATATTESLYPTCPAPAPPASGTGTSTADISQLGDVVSYLGSDPPETMQCNWNETPHPKFKKFKPFMVNPGPVCP
jgi:hypothetical protein